jgi:hypothetical protein
MRTNRYFLAAAVAIGGFSFIPQASAQNAVQRAGNAIERAGERLTGTTRPSDSLAPDAEDIRETLREVTQAALTKGGLDDMVERFVDADRDRLNKDNDKFISKDHTTLDGRIAEFQKDWKAKYNQDFKIKDKEAVFNSSFASIIQSEIGDNARLAAEQQNNTGMHVNNPPTGMQPDVNTSQANRDANKIGGGDTNREPGRNIASVHVTGSHGLPGFTVPMIHELPDSWKIDAPDSLTAQQFHDNLLKHLTELDEHKDQWPADVNDAYRLVSHHVLMSILNLPDTGGNQMNPGMNMGNTNTGMNNTPSGSVTPNNSTGTNNR